jgi:hypothetical protein
MGLAGAKRFFLEMVPMVRDIYFQNNEVIEQMEVNATQRSRIIQV